MTTRRWQPAETSLFAGMARADITPPVGIRAHNWGASRTEVATGVHRPLTATALAVRDAGGRWHYLVSLDLGWWRDTASYRRLVDPVRERLGVDGADLLVHLVHTHAGPSICDLGTGGEEPAGAAHLPAYHARLVETVGTICAEARDRARPAVATWRYGRSDLAVVRNLPCDGRDVVAFDPDAAAADDTLAVGRLATEDGRVLGTVLNYAAHPTTLAHHNSLISPDYVGAAREVLEDATGAPCLFLQGASGELSPRRQYLAGTEDADRNGRILGLGALSTLTAMDAPATGMEFGEIVESGAPLGLWRDVPVSPPVSSSFAEYSVRLPGQRPERDWSGIDPHAAAERRRRAAALAEGYLHTRPDGSVYVEHPYWIWELGDAALIAHPGEAFSALQTRLRAAHPERVLLVANITGGPGFVYLPDAASYDRDQYQVWQTLVARGGLERLVEDVDARLRASERPASGTEATGTEATGMGPAHEEGEQA